MRKVGIEALRDDLVASVEAGETVLVMDCERVVAELGPPRRARMIEDDFFERGRREGWYTPAEVDWREPFPERGSPPAGDEGIRFKELMDELAKDRADR